MADEFLRLACLTYETDVPGRTRQADLMLDTHPRLAVANVFTTAATGSYEALDDLLTEEPDLAVRQGGPFAWEPLLYLSYARLRAPGRWVESARLLLECGADPNSGYLWEGLTSPFTALTGAFGGGERDEPAHPQALELARLLLRSGADPNDSQSPYNRGLGDEVFTDDTTHLELLLEHGLGSGNGGPWRARLGPVLHSPRQLLRDELSTAALQAARTELDCYWLMVPRPTASARTRYTAGTLPTGWRCGTDTLKSRRFSPRPAPRRRWTRRTPSSPPVCARMPTRSRPWDLSPLPGR